MRLTLKENRGLSRGKILILLLLFNSFSWYFLGRLTVEKLAEPHGSASALELSYPISIIVSALIGAFFCAKLRQRSFLIFWHFLGVIASLLPIVQSEALFGSSAISAFVFITVLGASLGFGMPFLLSYFAENTPIEDRGKIGGLTFFLVTVSAPIVIFVIGKIPYLSLVFLAFWRLWSIPIMLATPKSISTSLHSEKRILTKRSLLPSMFHNRTFVLYFTAWFLFSMVDGLQEYVLTRSSISEDVVTPFFNEAMNAVELVFAGASALIAGVAADWIGRKKIIISGFVSLGVAYAILSLNPNAESMKYFFAIVDGFAIGLLWTMFTIVLWGELSRINIEKHYAVGEIPYFLTQLIALALLSAPSPPLEAENVFPLAAFFLFIAVIPLLYAPETLPEEKIQERELKMYTEEALKFRQEAEQKIKS